MKTYMSRSSTAAKAAKRVAPEAVAAHVPNSAYESGNQASDPDLLHKILSRAHAEPSKAGGMDSTGIPAQMKAGFEHNSGFSFDDVRVHYNSPKPAQMNAHAYTQGTGVHIAPGQERHLGHELGHVVQQKQGRVSPMVQFQGVSANIDASLESEADAMGRSFSSGRNFGYGGSVSDFGGGFGRSGGFGGASAPSAPAVSGGGVVQMKAQRATCGVFGGKGSAFFQRIGFGHLKLNHSHILFEHKHALPRIGSNEEKHDVGFGSDGVYSSDNDASYQNNFNNKETIVDSYMQEKVLAHCARELSGEMGNYNLLTNNCQVFVKKLIAKYNDRKDKIFNATWRASVRTINDNSISGDDKKAIVELQKDALSGLKGDTNVSPGTNATTPFTDNTLDHNTEEEQLADSLSLNFKREHAGRVASADRRERLRSVRQIKGNRAMTSEEQALNSLAVDCDIIGDQERFEEALAALRQMFIDANDMALLGGMIPIEDEDNSIELVDDENDDEFGLIEFVGEIDDEAVQSTSPPASSESLDSSNPTEHITPSSPPPALSVPTMSEPPFEEVPEKEAQKELSGGDALLSDADSPIPEPPGKAATTATTATTAATTIDAAEAAKAKMFEKIDELEKYAADHDIKIPKHQQQRLKRLAAAGDQAAFDRFAGNLKEDLHEIEADYDAAIDKLLEKIAELKSSAAARGFLQGEKKEFRKLRFLAYSGDPAAFDQAFNHLKEVVDNTNRSYGIGVPPATAATPTAATPTTAPTAATPTTAPTVATPTAATTAATTSESLDSSSPEEEGSNYIEWFDPDEEGPNHIEWFDPDEEGPNYIEWFDPDEEGPNYIEWVPDSDADPSVSAEPKSEDMTMEKFSILQGIVGTELKAKDKHLYLLNHLARKDEKVLVSAIIALIQEESKHIDMFLANNNKVAEELVKYEGRIAKIANAFASRKEPKLVNSTS